MLLLQLYQVLSLLTWAGAGAVAPDVTGLVGTPYFSAGPSRTMAGRSPPQYMHMPLKFWANPRDSALKPRRRDRDPHNLMALMGTDFDPRWMRRTKREEKSLNISSVEQRATTDDQKRPSLSALWEAAQALKPPSTWPDLPPGYQHKMTPESPALWLVALGSCPAREEWSDLGLYFWPRLVRRVECERTARTTRPGAPAPTAGCGWPPGKLSCAPGVAKTLHLLRWHCRLRSSGSAVWARLAHALGKSTKDPQPKRKRRKRYRCEWLKVPYPVPADCQCGGI